MNIENLQKKSSEIRERQNVSDMPEKPRKLEKLRKIAEKRSRHESSEDDMANYARKEGERLIKDLHEKSEAEISKVTAQLAKDISNPTLTSTEITNLKTQADKDKDEIKQLCDKTISETQIQLKYRPHAVITYLHTTMAKENTKKENQASIDKAKKTVDETAAKLYKRSAELEKIEGKVSKEVEGLQKSLKDLEDVRNSDGASHAQTTESQTTVMLNQYYKDLTNAHDAMSTNKTRNAAKNAYKNKETEVALEDALDPHKGTLRTEFNTAHETIYNENIKADERAAAVKALLRQAIKQHTTFRLSTASPSDAQFLSPEAHIEKRLNEVLAQDDVHRTLQQARQVLDIDPQKFQKSLKKAVKETIRYAWQSNAQEEAIHQKAAKQFIRRARASSEIRRDVWQDATASLKPGRKETIASIENADAEMQRALDLVHYFSPEASKKVQAFRKDFPDHRISPQQHDRATALDEIQHNLKKSSLSLPELHENIQAYLNIDTKTDTQKIHLIAESAHNELMQLWKKQDNDKSDIEHNEYKHLNKQIGERYATAIKKAQGTKDMEKAEARRDASLAELARLYPKETIGTKIEKVQKNVLKLQEVLMKRDKKIIELNDTLAEGERAYATQRRYETNNQGEYLVLEERMLEQGQKIQAAQAKLTAALEKEASYQDELHKAENERSDAKDDFEKVFREIDRKRMKDGSLEETSESDPLVDEAKKRYKNAREAVRKAKQKCEEAATEKIEATTAKEQEQQKYNTLETQRDMAKKRYDSDEDKVKRYIEGSKEIMKATIAYERQQRLMKEFYRYQVRAAVIAGISEAVMDSLKKTGVSQYTSINNMLMKS